MDQWRAAMMSGYGQEPAKQPETPPLPLNARGDLLTYTNSLSRLPIGKEGSLLRVNLQAQSGLEYVGCVHPDTDKSLVLGQDAAKSVSGTHNTAIGQKSLSQLGSGVNNTALGSDSLASVTVQNNNTAIGAFALSQNIADGNTAIGNQSSMRSTTSTNSTAVGNRTLATNISGCHNTAVGSDALMSTLSHNNTAIGSMALRDNTGGEDNTAIGTSASQDNEYGSRNVATGYRSLYSNGNGSDNTALGTNALEYLVHGSNNTAIGSSALVNTIAGDNTAIGFKAGENNTTGSGNLFLGQEAGSKITTAGNCVVIGSIPGRNISDATFIANVHDANVTGASVMVDTFGRLGITLSSKRFKDTIQPMGDEISDKLMQLEPVTFCYKDDPTKIKHYGLIAEQVHEIFPEIVVMKQETQTKMVSEKRPDGTVHQRAVNLPTGNKPYTVQYEKLIPMLLHEIIRLRAEVDALIMKDN